MNNISKKLLLQKKVIMDSQEFLSKIRKIDLSEAYIYKSLLTSIFHDMRYHNFTDSEIDQILFECAINECNNLVVANSN